jgi:hypothetical protein
MSLAQHNATRRLNRDGCPGKFIAADPSRPLTQVPNVHGGFAEWLLGKVDEAWSFIGKSIMEEARARIQMNIRMLGVRLLGIKGFTMTASDGSIVGKNGQGKISAPLLIVLNLLPGLIFGGSFLFLSGAVVPEYEYASGSSRYGLSDRQWVGCVFSTG